MIQANELRIGNLMLMSFENSIEVMTARSIGFISTANAKGHNHPFDPIPLTEEWLLKMGFVSCDSKFEDSPPLLSIQISNNESLNYEDGSFFIASISGHQIVTLWNEPKYVHQLQNLYFALTGEELTIQA